MSQTVIEKIVVFITGLMALSLELKILRKLTIVELIWREKNSLKIQKMIDWIEIVLIHIIIIVT